MRINGGLERSNWNLRKCHMRRKKSSAKAHETQQKVNKKYWKL